MKSTTFAIAAMSMASLASARAIHKAREVSDPVRTRNGFELDLFTFKQGQTFKEETHNLFSRDDEFIYVKLAEDDYLLRATLRASNTDVICLLQDKNLEETGLQFGGVNSDPNGERFNTPSGTEVGAVACFFRGESDKISGEPAALRPDEHAGEPEAQPPAEEPNHEWHAPTENTDKPEPQPPKENVEEHEWHAPAEPQVPTEGSASRQAFEMDLIYQNTGTRNLFSREEGKIEATLKADDLLIGAVVRSVGNNVLCTIKEAGESESERPQVRIYGGKDQSEKIALSEDESKRALGGTVGCFFEE